MYTDSGADITIVPTAWYKTGMGKLSKTKDILQPFGSPKPLDMVAKFQMVLETKRGATQRAEVYIVKGAGTEPLLGMTKPSPWGSSPSTQSGETRLGKRRKRESGGSLTRSGLTGDKCSRTGESAP